MCVLTGYINLHTAKKLYLSSFGFSLLVFNFLLRFVCWTARPSQPCLRPWSHWQLCASTCRWTATRLRTRTSHCCLLTHVAFTLKWTWRNLSKTWVSTGLRTGYQSYLIRISLWLFCDTFSGLVPSAVLVVTKKWDREDRPREPTSPPPPHQHKRHQNETDPGTEPPPCSITQ